MIRILVDELGDGHNDIILKIDTTPSFIQIADLYYMADFLGLDSEKMDINTSALGIEYIQYLSGKLNNLGNSAPFMIFDISDQYIGGLFISKRKKSLVEMTYVITYNIHGYEISRENIDNLIKERQPGFTNEGKWILSQQAIDEGLKWSIEKLKN